MDFQEWKDFEGNAWKDEIDVRDFIQSNYTPYEGDDSFLVGPTEKTKKLWDEVLKFMKKKEKMVAVLDADTKTPSSI